MERLSILSAVRTPIGKFQGGLSSFSAPELGGKVIAESIRRAGIVTELHPDEVILGRYSGRGSGRIRRAKRR